MTASQQFKQKDHEYQLAYGAYMAGAINYPELKKIERQRAKLLAQVKKEIKQRVFG